MSATFDELYRSLREPVTRLCLHVTGNRAAAEDAVQDTFLSVHRALSGFRGESQLSTWVYRIAVRAALKARARRAATSVDDLSTHELPVSEHPEPALAAREEMRKVAAAMATLSAEQRIVLSLFALDGLGHREIAEVLGVPEGTVWSRLHKARKKLLESLEQG